MSASVSLGPGKQEWSAMLFNSPFYRNGLVPTTVCVYELYSTKLFNYFIKWSSHEEKNNYYVQQQQQQIPMVI